MNKFSAIASLIAASAFAGGVSADTQRSAEKTAAPVIQTPATK
ncbi:MAG: hypothetical protein ACRERY_16740 [Pseudomonas sp.]